MYLFIYFIVCSTRIPGRSDSFGQPSAFGLHLCRWHTVGKWYHYTGPTYHWEIGFLGYSTRLSRTALSGSSVRKRWRFCQSRWFANIRDRPMCATILSRYRRRHGGFEGWGNVRAECWAVYFVPQIRSFYQASWWPLETNHPILLSHPRLPQI